MIQYQLVYFDVRGLGEVSRQLFHLANVEFEDIRIPRNDEQQWKTLKASMPFAQLPILRFQNSDTQERFEIPQSSAIGRYLAKKFGYSGNNPEEEAMVDAVIDQFKDFLVSQKQLTLAIRTKRPEEYIVDRIIMLIIQKIFQKGIIDEVVNPAKKIYFNILKKLLQNSSSGYLVGNSITWADLQISDNLTTLKGFGLFDPEDEPILQQFHQKITNTPKLKSYFENRPVSLL